MFLFRSFIQCIIHVTFIDQKRNGFYFVARQIFIFICNLFFFGAKFFLFLVSFDAIDIIIFSFYVFFFFLFTARLIRQFER